MDKRFGDIAIEQGYLTGAQLKELLDIIDNKDAVRMKAYLTKIRNHVKE